MNLETVILGFLNLEPMSGYDLSKQIDSSVGFFWHATHPQIYSTLKKLEVEGYVTFEHEIQKSGPTKKIYTITATGKQFFLDELTPIEPQLVKFPLLVSMFLGAELGIEFWRNALPLQIAEREKELQVYNQILKEIPKDDPSNDLGNYLRLRTLYFGIGYQKFFIKWLQKTLQELEK
ncbi:MAG: PadR family transcriptional regulator [Fidelibacterota bacterium]